MLLRAVSQALDRLDCRGQAVLVAVSGGIDSVVLLECLRDLAQEFQLKLSIGHVNHGLARIPSFFGLLRLPQVAVPSIREDVS